MLLFNREGTFALPHGLPSLAPYLASATPNRSLSIDGTVFALLPADDGERSEHQQDGVSSRANRHDLEGASSPRRHAATTVEITAAQLRAVLTRTTQRRDSDWEGGAEDHEDQRRNVSSSSSAAEVLFKPPPRIATTLLLTLTAASSRGGVDDDEDEEGTAVRFAGSSSSRYRESTASSSSYRSRGGHPTTTSGGVSLLPSCEAASFLTLAASHEGGDSSSLGHLFLESTIELDVGVLPTSSSSSRSADANRPTMTARRSGGGGGGNSSSQFSYDGFVEWFRRVSPLLSHVILSGPEALLDRFLTLVTLGQQSNDARGGCGALWSPLSASCVTSADAIGALPVNGSFGFPVSLLVECPSSTDDEEGARPGGGGSRSQQLVSQAALWTTGAIRIESIIGSSSRGGVGVGGGWTSPSATSLRSPRRATSPTRRPPRRSSTAVVPYARAVQEAVAWAQSLRSALRLTTSLPQWRSRLLAEVRQVPLAHYLRRQQRQGAAIAMQLYDAALSTGITLLGSASSPSSPSSSSCWTWSDVRQAANLVALHSYAQLTGLGDERNMLLLSESPFCVLQRELDEAYHQSMRNLEVEVQRSAQGTLVELLRPLSLQIGRMEEESVPVEEFLESVAQQVELYMKSPIVAGGSSSGGRSVISSPSSSAPGESEATRSAAGPAKRRALVDVLQQWILPNAAVLVAAQKEREQLRNEQKDAAVREAHLRIAVLEGEVSALRLQSASLLSQLTHTKAASDSLQQLLNRFQSSVHQELEAAASTAAELRRALAMEKFLTDNLSPDRVADGAAPQPITERDDDKSDDDGQSLTASKDRRKGGDYKALEMAEQTVARCVAWLHDLGAPTHGLLLEGLPRATALIKPNGGHAEVGNRRMADTSLHATGLSSLNVSRTATPTFQQGQSSSFATTWQNQSVASLMVKSPKPQRYQAHRADDNNPPHRGGMKDATNGGDHHLSSIREARQQAAEMRVARSAKSAPTSPSSRPLGSRLVALEEPPLLSIGLLRGDGGVGSDGTSFAAVRSPPRSAMKSPTAEDESRVLRSMEAVSSMQNKIHALREQLARQQQLSGEAQQRLEQEKQRHEATMRDLDQQTSLTEECHEMLKTLRQQLETAQSSQQQTQETLQHTEGTLARTEELLHSSEQRVSDLLATLEETTTHFAAERGQLTSTQQQLGAECRETKDLLERARLELAMHRSEASQARSECQRLEAALSHERSERREERQRTEQRFAELQSQLQSLDADSERERRHLEQAIAQASARGDSLQDRAARLEADLARSNERVSDLQQTLTQLEARVKDSSTDNTALKAALDDKTRREDDLSAKLRVALQDCRDRDHTIAILSDENRSLRESRRLLFHSMETLDTFIHEQEQLSSTHNNAHNDGEGAAGASSPVMMMFNHDLMNGGGAAQPYPYPTLQHEYSMTQFGTAPSPAMLRNANSAALGKIRSIAESLAREGSTSTRRDEEQDTVQPPPTQFQPNVSSATAPLTMDDLLQRSNAVHQSHNSSSSAAVPSRSTTTRVVVPLPLPLNYGDGPRPLGPHLKALAAIDSLLKM